MRDIIQFILRQNSYTVWTGSGLEKEYLRILIIDFAPDTITRLN